MQKEMEKKMQPQRSMEQKGLQTQRSVGQKELHSMGTAIRPVERHGMEAIKFFLYDPKEGRIMGRTPKSWALITVFYTIYYSLLAGFWALCFFIFYSTTIDEQVPRWNGKDWNGIGRWGNSPALIGQSPALGIRPNQTDAQIESSMIMYNHQQEGDDKEKKISGYGGWVNRTKAFLEQYKDCTNEKLFCAETELVNTALKNDSKACTTGKYGWDKGKPCIFLKLNKIFGLEHDYYNQTDNPKESGYISIEKEKRKEKEIDFPEEIIKIIKDNKDKAKDDNNNQVWVHCKGENPADEENMGDLSYFPPSRGFHKKFNLFDLDTKKAGYRSPLVAIKFNNPKIGVFLHVECRAWANNIGYNHMDRIGKAHFELIIYDKTINTMSKQETDILA